MTGAEVSRVFPIFSRSTWGKQYSTLDSGKVKKARARKNNRKLPLLDSNTQYAIDAGQKNFDAIRCTRCSMFYTRGEAQDEKQHRAHHDLIVNGVKFSGWKNERLVKYFESGSKIISVKPSDPKTMIKKVNSLCEFADNELGISMDAFKSMKSSSQFLIHITEKKRIAGFVAAEEITEAYEVIPGYQGLVNLEKFVPARLGIARLWIHPAYRNQGIATVLLDTVREKFNPLSAIKKTEIAFSDPTDGGHEFARKYTGKDNYLVY